MRYLKGRGEFNFDRIDESMLYLSPKFRKRLQEIDNEISKKILDSELTDVKPDMTLIDISGDDGFISFNQINKADKLVRDVHNSIDLKNGILNDEKDGFPIKRPLDIVMLDFLYRNDIDKNSISTGIFTKGRNKTKIGRLVNRLFPGEFKDEEIEIFVNMFKSKKVDNERFELVSGEDIKKWYDCKGVSGSLGGSCMSGKNSDIFDIYVENPEVCRLLVLLNKDGKLIGRSLIWKVNVENLDFEYFMDRIYTNLDSDKYKFMKFAQDKEWAHKTEQNFNSHKDITYDGKEYSLSMSVDIGKSVDGNYEYEYYPYMDTFSEYDISDGTLYNNESSENDGIILDDTHGGHSGGGYWSEYFDRMVPESEAVYSEPLGDWLTGFNSTYVESQFDNSIDGWYPLNHNDIFYYDGDYYHVRDGVISDDDGEWIPLENAVNVLHLVNSDGSISDDSNYWLEDSSELYVSFNDIEEYEWFQEMNKNHKWDDYFNGILKIYLVEDYNDDWVFKPTSVTTFETKKGEWLMEEDIVALGEEERDIDGSVNKRIESEYDYFKRVWIESDRNPYETIKDTNEEIKKLHNILDPNNKQLDFDDKDEYLYKVKVKLNSLYSFQRDFKKRLSDRYNSDPDSLINDRVNSMFNGSPNESSIRHKMISVRKEFIESWTGHDGGFNRVYKDKFEQAYNLINDNKYTEEDYVKSTIFVYTYILPALERGDIKMNRKDMSKLYKEVTGNDVTDFNKEISLGYKLIKQHNDRNMGMANIEHFLRDFDDGIYEALEKYLDKKLKNND